MALLETITDDFEDGTLATTWSSSHGGVVESGGFARIPSGTGYPALATPASHTLQGSSVFARVYPAGAGTSTTATSEMLIDSPTGGTRLLIIVDQVNGNLSFRNDVGYGDGAAVTLAYDATAHAWWRIREASGTVYMDTSPDAATWTNRRSFATPTWATSTTLPLLFSTHRDVADAGLYCDVDNVNLAPAPATPPATPTNVAVTHTDTTASVSWTASADATGYDVEYRAVSAGTTTEQNVEPWSEVTLSGSGTGTWEQTGGKPVTLSGTGSVVTFTAPASMIAEGLTFTYGTETVVVNVSRASSGIVKADGTIAAVQFKRVV